MEISRRWFVSLLTALGARAVFPLDGMADARAEAGAVPSYAEVRAELASTRLFWVPYCHNDYGWLCSHRWDLERIPLSHREALEIMRREPEFKWYIDVEFEALAPFLDRYPELLGELKERIKDGRWGVAPGSFCNPENAQMEPEIMIRNLVLGRRDFEAKFPGVNLEVAAFNDSWAGHSQMPQILTQAGYRFYRVTVPMEDLQKKGYKSEFRWEGLDGTEIVFSCGPYDWENIRINDYQKNWEGAVVTFYESAARALLAGSVAGLVYMPVGSDYRRALRADRGTEEPYMDLPGFLREWRKRESPPFVFATPIDYFREVEKVRSSLAKVSGVIDVVGGWPFFYGSDGSRGIYNFRERNSRDLVEAEIFSSLASVAGARYPGERIEALWYAALTLHPHGGAYLEEEDVQNLLQVGQNVEYESRRLRTEAMEKLGQRIPVQPEKQAIALFNPLGQRRRELVEIETAFAQPGTKRVKITDSEGKPLPQQLLRVRHKEFAPRLNYQEAAFLVEAQIPALGYTTVYVEPDTGEEDDQHLNSPVTVLESSYARLELGETGIESIEDKVRGARYSGAGNVVYYVAKDASVLHGGPIIGELKIRDAAWFKVEDGPLRTTAMTSARLGDHAVRMRVSIHHTMERIDFDVSMDSVGGSGYFAVAVPFDYDGSLTAGIPFGAEPRPLSREPFGDAGLEANMFFAHHWVDYNDGRKGLTLLAAEGKRGFRFDLQTRTLAHVLLVTNAPRPDGPNHSGFSEVENYFVSRYFAGTGTHTFTYALIPHGGDWREAQSLARAQERLYPIRCNRVEYHRSLETVDPEGPIQIRPRQGPDLPLEKSFLSVSPETVALSSWQQKDGGHDLRLYESAGKETDVTIQFPFRGASCVSVDLNGRHCNSPRLSVQADEVKLHLRPWQLVTLRFQPPGKSDQAHLSFDRIPVPKDAFPHR